MADTCTCTYIHIYMCIYIYLRQRKPLYYNPHFIYFTRLDLGDFFFFLSFFLFQGGVDGDRPGGGKKKITILQFKFIREGFVPGMFFVSIFSRFSRGDKMCVYMYIEVCVQEPDST